MGTKLDAMGFDFSDFGQAEYLVAPAIGQNRAGPAHETMEPTGLADDFQAGPDEQMIGIAQDDRCARFAQFSGIEGFDCGLRAHRHESRSLDLSPRGPEPPQAGRRTRISFD